MSAADSKKQEDLLIETLGSQYPYKHDRHGVKYRIEKAQKEMYQLAEALAFLALEYRSRGVQDRYEFFKNWVLHIFIVLRALDNLSEYV